MKCRESEGLHMIIKILGLRLTRRLNMCLTYFQNFQGKPRTMWTPLGGSWCFCRLEGFVYVEINCDSCLVRELK